MATMGTSNDYFLGVDVGTGSVRVCVIDETGEIKGVESKEIKTWHEKADYYVLSSLIPLYTFGLRADRQTR